MGNIRFYIIEDHIQSKIVHEFVDSGPELAEITFDRWVDLNGIKDAVYSLAEQQKVVAR